MGKKRETVDWALMTGRREKRVRGRKCMVAEMSENSSANQEETELEVILRNRRHRLRRRDAAALDLYKRTTWERERKSTPL